MNDLKIWIKDHCFSKNGSLNNRINIITWWKKYPDQLTKIIEKTSYLETDNISQRIFHILKDIPIGICHVCGNKTEFRQFKKGYREHCSIECSSISDIRISKIIKNNDYEAIHLKRKKFNLLEYGEENFFKTKEFKTKSKKTKLIRYDNEYYNNSDKYKETCIKKYGFNHPEKINTAHFNFEDIYDMHFEKKMSCVEIAKKLNVAMSTIIYMLKDNGHKPFIQSVSIQEKEICLFLNELKIDYEISNRKILNGKELDIYISSSNLAIELNGLYWHSFDRKETKEEIYKHFNKTKDCLKLGIKLLHFTDFEWKNKNEICKSIIKTNLNLYDKKIRASKCKVIVPTNEEYHKFLDENHIQGNINSSEKLALIYDNEIVSLMSIGKSRYSNNKYELLRFVNKCNYRVYGAASKLFNILKKEDMISYCSIDYFDGKMYDSLGFKKIHTSSPNYFYVLYGTKIINRINAQKHKLKEFLKIYDENLTEYQNMFNNNYRRYWNCGNTVWVYKSGEKKLGS